MTDINAVSPDHLRRAAFVYIRQSSLAQVDNNTESTRRQYALVDKALQLGWPRAAVSVVDDDLGLSGSKGGGPHRLCPHGHRGRHGPGRHRALPGGLAPGIGCWTCAL